MTLVPSQFSDKRADECLGAVAAAYADADLTGSELITVLKLGTPCNRVVVGPAGRGENCSENADCDGSSGFECVRKGNVAEGTCQAPEEVGPGLKCAAAQQVCSDGFYCNGQNCIAAKSVGDACVSDEECGSANTCAEDGTCTARLAVDSPCSEDRQCVSGICYQFGTSDRTCVDRIRLSRSEPICEDLR